MFSTFYITLPFFRHTLALIAAFGLSSCAADGGGEGGGGGPVGKGGPHSLVGFSWSSEPITVNGIQFELGLRFTRDTVHLSNTCDGTLTAEVSAPIRYTYEAEVLEQVEDRVEDGDDYCEVSLARGSFTAEVVDDGLKVSDGNETRVFKPAGSVAGIYGDWAIEVAGLGELVWSMGGGEIYASLDCDWGQSASVSATANFANYLVIEEAAFEEVEDDFGLACSASIDASTLEYYFEGDDLILSMGGETARLSKN